MCICFDGTCSRVEVAEFTRDGWRCARIAGRDGVRPTADDIARARALVFGSDPAVEFHAGGPVPMPPPDVVVLWRPASGGSVPLPPPALMAKAAGRPYA